MNHSETDVVACGMFVVILTAAAVAAASYKRPRRQRRWGVRPINQQRREKGHFNNIFQDMKNIDPEQFFVYTRMSHESFLILLNLVKDKLTKHSIREPLSPEHRLALTLYYLAHGCSMQVVAWSFLVGKSTVSVVVRETCQAIWDVLSPIYMKKPSIEDWQHIANEFNVRWNFPNCCGALDGKHVVIQAPNKSGTAFFNYKKTFSIVLMAVCDANYKFVLVDIGAYGSQNDAGVFNDSVFGRALQSGTIKLPPEAPLPGTNVSFPHYIVGDEAFPLKSYIMRPYPGRHLGDTKNIFNYRLSRARRTIENTFGILSARWRIFRHNIIAEVTTIEKITAAAVCLHNFLRTEEQRLPIQQQVYCPPLYADSVNVDGNIRLGQWREDSLNRFENIGRMGFNYAGRNVSELRETLSHYLSNEGAVPWQWSHVSRGGLPQE